MILNLQSLRAFAAINVILFHIIDTAADYNFAPEAMKLIEFWGANGIDIFFVISGFVMHYTQCQNPRGALTFFKSRLVRIVPIYWFITLLSVVAFYFAPSAVINSQAPEISRVVESFLFLSGLMSNETPIVYVGWTLEWEMLFYAVFALSLLIGSKQLAMIFIFVVLSIAALVSNNFIVIEFFLGIAVAHLYLTVALKKSTGLIICGIGFALLIATLWITYPKEVRVIFWGLPATLIVLGAVYAPQLKSAALNFLGDASYSIYLIQMLTIPIFYKVATRLGVTLDPNLLALTCVLFSVLAGAVMYLMIEKPLTRSLKRKLLS